MNKIKNEIKLIKLWDSLKTVDFSNFKLDLNNFKIIEKELEYIDISILQDNSLLKLVKNHRYNILSIFLEYIYSSTNTNNNCNNDTYDIYKNGDEEIDLEKQSDDKDDVYDIYSLFYIYLLLFTDELTHTIGDNNHILKHNNNSDNGDNKSIKDLEINRKYLCRYLMYNILNNKDKENKVNKIFYKLKNDIESIKIINLFSKLNFLNIPLILPYNDISDYVYLFQLNLLDGETCWSPYIDYNFINDLISHGFITIATKVNIAEIFDSTYFSSESDKNSRHEDNSKDSDNNNNENKDKENNQENRDSEENNNKRKVEKDNKENITSTKSKNKLGKHIIKYILRGILDYKNYKNYIDKDIVILIPKMHTIRCVLYPRNIKIKKKAIKISKKYKLTINRSLSEVLDEIAAKHGENWMYPELRIEFLKLHHYPRSNIKSDYLDILYDNNNSDKDKNNNINNNENSYNSTINNKDKGMVSVELWDMEDNLVAGEVGYVNGGVYTSLSGFHKVNNTGHLQMILLSALLHFDGFKLWDLGIFLEYKKDMGAKCVSRNEFLELLNEYKQENVRFEIPRKYINDNNCEGMIKDFIQDIDSQDSN